MNNCNFCKQIYIHKKENKYFYKDLDKKIFYFNDSDTHQHTKIILIYKENNFFLYSICDDHYYDSLLKVKYCPICGKQLIIKEDN